MKFSLVIHAAPYSGQAALSALNFALAALENKHEIYRLFFFSDGVHNANSQLHVPQDEENIQRRWEALVDAHGIDSVVCVTSAIKRGILDANEAKRHGFDAINLSDKSAIAGLGQLVDACLQSDRVINFG